MDIARSVGAAAALCDTVRVRTGTNVGIAADFNIAANVNIADNVDIAANVNIADNVAIAANIHCKPTIEYGTDATIQNSIEFGIDIDIDIGTNSNTTGSTHTGLGDTYTPYSGDGTTAEGWPAKSSWVDFNTMWTKNQILIVNSCSIWSVTDNSVNEIDEMLSAINSISISTGVDRRFILAVIVQESKGCVRVPTTFGSVANPGLMQSHDGSGTCNNDGVIKDPCPSSEIRQMIQDGTAGTTSGPGLMQDLVAADATHVSRYYKAARIYNSGSIPADGNLGGPGATPCYASDIANRLTGWVTAVSQCTLT